jgi:hypothetical protein
LTKSSWLCDLVWARVRAIGLGLWLGLRFGLGAWGLGLEAKASKVRARG